MLLRRNVSSTARRSPAHRSSLCRTELGPPTKTILRFPISSKCSPASSPPRRSSTATEHAVALSASSSTKTTAKPRERRRSISRRSRVGSTGVMRIPATRCSSRKRRWRCCRWGDPSELHSTTEYPRRSSAASAPRATSVKNGLPASRTTSPTILLWVDRRRDADPLRIYPSSSMAESTAVRVASDTASGRLRTFDTVPNDTPARAATSRISADFRVIRFHQRVRYRRARRRRRCRHA